ncbi:MAG: hypothetical protein IT442_16320 [Phycisphaeraceae bacterium]|nr:hypothetical protein [Phycisphaeraceae bacterium]
MRHRRSVWVLAGAMAWAGVCGGQASQGQASGPAETSMTAADQAARQNAALIYWMVWAQLEESGQADWELAQGWTSGRVTEAAWTMLREVGPVLDLAKRGLDEPVCVWGEGEASVGPAMPAPQVRVCRRLGGLFALRMRHGLEVGQNPIGAADDAAAALGLARAGAADAMLLGQAGAAVMTRGVVDVVGRNMGRFDAAAARRLAGRLDGLGAGTSLAEALRMQGAAMADWSVKRIQEHDRSALTAAWEQYAGEDRARPVVHAAIAKDDEHAAAMFAELGGLLEGYAQAAEKPAWEAIAAVGVLEAEAVELAKENPVVGLVGPRAAAIMRAVIREEVRLGILREVAAERAGMSQGDGLKDPGSAEGELEKVSVGEGEVEYRSKLLIEGQAVGVRVGE